MNSEAARLAELIESDKRMIGRLSKEAFQRDSSKGHFARFGIASGAALQRGSTNPIHMAKALGYVPSPTRSRLIARRSS